MKKEELYDAITEIDEKLVTKAHKVPLRLRLQKRWMLPLVALLAVSIVVTALVLPKNAPLFGGISPAPGNTIIAPAAQPGELTPPDYDKWNGDWEAYQETVKKWHTDVRRHVPAVKQFVHKSTKAFLEDANEENRVFSPLNVYLAVSMMAEISAGNTQNQILNALGVSDVSALRDNAQSLWRFHNRDTEYYHSLLANSFWLSNTVSYNRKPFQTLANTYYASSFSGAMGSKEYDQLLQTWLNENTDNLLGEHVKEIKMEPQTILSLASTITFRAKWYDDFKQENTQPGTFHTINGDITHDFMHSTETLEYHLGENFTAVAKEFGSAGKMWFFLPDEETSATSLLDDEEFFECMTPSKETDYVKKARVKLTVPKFDVNSKINLNDDLRKIGITDAFEENVADFSPASDQLKGVPVSKVEHAARVAIDEEGCVAAAFTVMVWEGIDFSEKILDMTLDRPFLFAITGNDGLPLFIGIVNQP